MVNASRALLKKHHLFSETSWCNSSTSDCWSEGCVIKSLRNQMISYWHEMSNMKNAFFVTGWIWILYTGFFLSGDTKSEENGNVNAKVKTNLLRAGIEPANLRIANISSTVLRSTNWAIEGLEYIKTTRNLESLTSWVFWGKSGCVLW